MILVFGSTGQVARELARVVSGATFLARAEADLAEPDSCAAAILSRAPKAVINAAAWTAVDAAEEDEAAAQVVNGDAPGAIARACAGLGIPFVQISSDYVFDGSGTAPWHPDSPTGPLGAYGRSKLAGEAAVRAAGGTHAILRTSWVFSAHGANFVKTMLRLGASRESLSVVDDQIGGPTPAADIAAACLTLAQALQETPELSGVYHLSGAPDVSWAGFAAEIMEAAGLACRIIPIPSRDYPQKAPRPANSRLDCTSLTEAFGIARPNWRTGLAQVLTELKDIPQ